MTATGWLIVDLAALVTCLSIAKDVLAVSKSMTMETNVWSQGEKCRRRREPGDEPGVWLQA